MALALTNDSDSSPENHGSASDSGIRGSSRRSSEMVRGPAKLWPMLLASSVAVASVIIGGLAFLAMRGRDSGTSSSEFVIPAPYDANRAESYLRAICDFGPRPSGSQAMTKQQDYLRDFFTNAGAAVELQAFAARNPETGAAVEMKNLIARWYPDRPKRFLVCAHYDTRPYPDRDPDDPKGRFVGANDGASGVAGMMELSHHVDRLPADVGIDMVLFDGEELVYREQRDAYFLGSTFFARTYVANPPPVRYQAGVLLDMIGDRELRIYYERNSWNYARDVCKSLFETAALLKADAFVARIRHEVRDDHIPLNQIARIPTIDLIDFDYPRPGIGAPQYWHTTKDVPENCSGQSIATVVYVLHQWLMRQ
jgi:glutaminyl-peptide cyclotransferase